MRAIRSTPPPAATGTTSFIGLTGHDLVAVSAWTVAAIVPSMRTATVSALPCARIPAIRLSLKCPEEYQDLRM
jgi:hypothetical protein